MFKGASTTFMIIAPAMFIGLCLYVLTTRWEAGSAVALAFLVKRLPIVFISSVAAAGVLSLFAAYLDHMARKRSK